MVAAAPSPPESEFSVVRRRPRIRGHRDWCGTRPRGLVQRSTAPSSICTTTEVGLQPVVIPAQGGQVRTFRGARRMADDVVGEVAHDRGRRYPGIGSADLARTQRANVGAGRYPVDGLGGRVRPIRSVPFAEPSAVAPADGNLCPDKVLVPDPVRMTCTGTGSPTVSPVSSATNTSAYRPTDCAVDAGGRRQSVRSSKPEPHTQIVPIVAIPSVQAVSIPAAPAAPSSGVVAIRFSGRWRPPVEPAIARNWARVWLPAYSIADSAQRGAVISVPAQEVLV